MYFLWRTCRQLTASNVAGLMTFSALAIVTKFSGFLLAPIVLALLGVAILARSPMTTRRGCAVAGLLAATTFVAIWAVYGFRYAPGGTSDSWLFQVEQTTMVQQRFAGAASLASWLDAHHVLPNAFTQGFLFSQASVKALPAFLAGDYSTEGWWYYFPLAFLIKTPLAFLALASAGLFVYVKRRGQLGLVNEAFIAIPILVFLAFAMMSNINIGLRHILPIYPFVVMMAAAGAMELAARRATRPASGRRTGPGPRQARAAQSLSKRGGPAQELQHGLLARVRSRPAPVALGIVTVVWVVEFASVYPHTLTFFNRFVGGPDNGVNYLADSNLDWGQDLKLLKEWMDEQGVAHINLAYFGSADPAYYGIDCTYLPGAPLFAEQEVIRPELPGYVAVSATVLSGVYLPERWRLHYGPLLAQEPVAAIGHSIFVYWVDRWPEVTEFTAASTGRPRDIDVLRRLADSLLQQKWYTGRKDGALNAFRRAADLNPTDVRMRGNLVLALLDTGRLSEAMAQARQAVALAPQDPGARELLGRALSAQPRPAPREHEVQRARDEEREGLVGTEVG